MRTYLICPEFQELEDRIRFEIARWFDSSSPFHPAVARWYNRNGRKWLNLIALFCLNEQEDRVMTLRLFNTLTGDIDLVTPADGQALRMYACGPTVYDYGHIGNFRTFLQVDVLRRFLY